MNTVAEYRINKGAGLFTRAHRSRPRDYGAESLGRSRKRIQDEVTPGKPYDMGESKADSDKVMGLLILELHDQGLCSTTLADIANSMLHGKSRSETLAEMRDRYAILDNIVQE